MIARRILAWAVGLILVGLYAYAVVIGVGNYIGMTTYLSAVIGTLPRVLLISGIAAPVLALGVALLLGRRRSAAMRILLLAVGLCVSAAIQLEITHLLVP